MNFLKRLTCQLLDGIAARCAGWAGRLDPQESEHTFTAPPGFAPQFQLPPSVSASPEEMLLLWQQPPVAIHKSKVLTTPDAAGQIQDSVEFSRLTVAGRVIAKVEAICVDNFGQVGKPEHLSGRCAFCQRVSFGAVQPCAQCGLVCCRTCGGPFLDVASGVTQFLCEQDWLNAEKNRDLWATPPPTLVVPVDSSSRRETANGSPRSQARTVHVRPSTRGGGR